MYLVTISDQGDFGKIMKRFLCEDETRANFLAGEALDKIADEFGPWYDYSVEYVEVRA